MNFSKDKLDLLYLVRAVTCFMFCLGVVYICPLYAYAAIEFTDVSEAAGTDRVNQTAGSAWGDVNGDGWPDLWVSNHDLTEPSLYLNMRDGTFTDAIESVIIGKDRADFHGGAWADFDNDGDQDLFLISGGASGRGYSANFLFVNQDGKLQNQAKELGVDYPFGRGRTPLLFDADADGKLDLLVMNRPRKNNQSPTAIFLQTDSGFVSQNARFDFNPNSKRSKKEKIKDLLSNAVHFRMRKGAAIIKSGEVFAQITDVFGDGKIELFAYMDPMRVYSTSTIPYEEITNDFDFPNMPAVSDVAIEDFDGDGKLDMFFARAFLTSDVVQTTPMEILGKVKGASAKKPKEVRLKTDGEVTFSIYSPWRDPTDPQKDPPPVWPGQMEPFPADGRPLTLSSDDPLVQENVPLPGRSISIHFDTQSRVWKIRSSYGQINFVVTSTQPIDQVSVDGFKTSKGVLEDLLMLNSEKGFRKHTGSKVLRQPTTSGSVVAGDFDNDMDVDLYLVCLEPVQNAPNILYENDGRGNFSKVADAGGAAGSEAGRGERVTMSDYDRDGFLDLFVTNGIGNPPFSLGPHQLFRNVGNDNNWIEIDLKGVKSNSDGIGAIVELFSGDKKQVRVQDGGIHSFAQDHQRIHFGLGKNEVVDKVTVRWPSGVFQEINGVDANQIIEIIEDE
jgi:hypothetical protein